MENKMMYKLRIRRIFFIFVCCLTASVLFGCEKQTLEEEPVEGISVYYLNKEDSKIVPVVIPIEADNTQDGLEFLIQTMAEQPEDLDLKPILGGKAEIERYRIEGKQIIINMKEEYYEIPSLKEILIRAAVVRTLTQVESIESVSMLVNDSPMTDVTGVVVGTMTPELFIDNAGKEINSYENTTLKLYMANAEGDKLVAINKEKVYNSNIALEKLVVEQIIAGLPEEEIYSTVNPDTKIISVTVKDGVCYVNLSEAFLTQHQNIKVTPEVTIYSLTNSLIELNNINKVQILINGETNIMYREKYSLTTIFERNLEIMATP